MNGRTTQMQPIKTSPIADMVTIYAPDGSPHRCAPIDAREILASGSGYTSEPPAKVQADEQQSEQQPVVSDTPIEEAKAEGETAQTVIDAALAGIERKRGRPAKSEK